MREGLLEDDWKLVTHLKAKEVLLDEHLYVYIPKLLEFYIEIMLNLRKQYQMNCLVYTKLCVYKLKSTYWLRKKS